MKENLLFGLLHLHVSFINLKNGENRRVLNVRRAHNFLIKKCHLIYIYIYIYITETFEIPTIFHVSIIKKKKNKTKHN